MSTYDTVNIKSAKKRMHWLHRVWQVERTVEYIHCKSYCISIYSGNIAAWTEPDACMYPVTPMYVPYVTEEQVYHTQPYLPIKSNANTNWN